MHVEDATLLKRAPITLRLLGEFEICTDGAIARTKSRKGRGLLAYLALAPARTASRERVAELLWSDRGEEQARSSLRQTLAELRKDWSGHGIPIAASRDTIGYRDDAISIDIDQILDAATRRDASSLARSVRAVGTGLLCDLDGLSPGFDDWLRGERVRREEQIVAVLIAAVEAMNGSADAADIQAILAALDRLSPFNEAVARLRMHADSEAGDAASLHRRYRRLSEDLRREFDTGPSVETTTLFNRLTALGPVEPLPIPSRGSRGVASAELTPTTVMISPFVAANPQSVTMELAADCTEDLLVALGEQHEIRIIALDLLDVDRTQAVCANALSAYIISGRLRASGDSLTASLQLGNVASGVVVWSQQLRLPLANPSDAIDRIVASAAGAVVPAIERDLAGPLSQRGDQRDTVTLYARGRRIRETRTLAEAMKAAELLEEVVARESRHVGARLRLAQIYNTDFRQMIAGHDATTYRQRAFTLAEEAVALDRSNVRARMRLAWCHLRGGNWGLAEREFRAAMEVMSYDADGLNECGSAFVHLGDLDIAEPLINRAFRLNPFAPADYHADYATLLALRGDAELAEEHFSVSGETGLLYLAVRLANLAALPAAAGAAQALGEAFRDGFAKIWAGKTRPSTYDILRWTEEVFPLRRTEHAAFMRERLPTMLCSVRQARRGNSN